MWHSCKATFSSSGTMAVELLSRCSHRFVRHVYSPSYLRHTWFRTCYHSKFNILLYCVSTKHVWSRAAPRSYKSCPDLWSCGTRLVGRPTQQSNNISGRPTYRRGGEGILWKMRRHLPPRISKRHTPQCVPPFNILVSRFWSTRTRLLRIVFAANNGAQFIAFVILQRYDHPLYFKIVNAALDNL